MAASHQKLFFWNNDNNIMDNHPSSIVILSYCLSNLVGLIILWSAVKRPMLGRCLLFLLFAWAALVNYSLANEHPEVYLNYSNYGFGWYNGFINGWFKNHIPFMVNSIVVGQILIAVGISLKGGWVKTASVGIIIFMLAIAPLGFAAAFPFSLTLSVAGFVIFKKDNEHYLWEMGKHSLHPKQHVHS